MVTKSTIIDSSSGQASAPTPETSNFEKLRNSRRSASASAISDSKPQFQFGRGKNLPSKSPALSKPTSDDGDAAQRTALKRTAQSSKVRGFVPAYAHSSEAPITSSDPVDPINPESMVGTALTSSPTVPADTVGSTREKLLKAYLSNENRPLKLDHVVSALKLRRAAEVYLEKGEWHNASRLKPRTLQNSLTHEQLRQLEGMNVDELIDDIEKDKSKYTRTDINEVAQRHFMNAFNIDHDEYWRGVKVSAHWEGLHSTASRAIVAGTSGVLAGVGTLPGSEGAAHAIVDAARTIGHFVSQSVVTPIVSGKLRVRTDVKESQKRVGGHPVVAQNIEQSRHMGQIGSDTRGKTQALREQIDTLKQNDSNSAQPVIDSAHDLHAAADEKYKARMGLNRTQTYSKAYGGAVTAFAGVGSAVTFVPVVGHVVGPAMLGAAVPMQWGAGELDERTKFLYFHYANLKWGDFLKDDARNVHWKDYATKHIREPAVRRAFVSAAENRVSDVRDVYMHKLGKLIRRSLEDDDQAWPRPEAEIIYLKRQIADFESFDPKKWSRIAPASTIGRILDDPALLEKQAYKARKAKPGEVAAQILQRYGQAFEGGISNGVTQPLADILASLPPLQDGHDAQHLAVPVEPHAEHGVIAADAVGNAVLAAATGEVRVDKARNKQVFGASAKTPGRPSQTEDGSVWLFKVNEGSDRERTIDLRSTAAYDRHMHSRWDRKTRPLRALPHAVSSGPVGLIRQVKVLKARRDATTAMQEALDALDAHGIGKAQPTAGSDRLQTLSGLRDRLYDYHPTRPADEEPAELLGVDGEPAGLLGNEEAAALEREVLESQVSASRTFDADTFDLSTALPESGPALAGLKAEESSPTTVRDNERPDLGLKMQDQLYGKRDQVDQTRKNVSDLPAAAPENGPDSGESNRGLGSRSPTGENPADVKRPGYFKRMRNWATRMSRSKAESV